MSYVQHRSLPVVVNNGKQQTTLTFVRSGISAHIISDSLTVNGFSLQYQTLSMIVERSLLHFPMISM
nr:hypothetical protein CJLB15_00053 [Campylobacter phage CJLB-15]